MKTNKHIRTEPYREQLKKYYIIRNIFKEQIHESGFLKHTRGKEFLYNLYFVIHEPITERLVKIKNYSIRFSDYDWHFFCLGYREATGTIYHKRIYEQTTFLNLDAEEEIDAIISKWFLERKLKKVEFIKQEKKKVHKI